jgi:hypothetical protein
MPVQWTRGDNSFSTAGGFGKDDSKSQGLQPDSGCCTSSARLLSLILTRLLWLLMGMMACGDYAGKFELVDIVFFNPYVAIDEFVNTALELLHDKM